MLIVLRHYYFIDFAPYKSWQLFRRYKIEQIVSIILLCSIRIQMLKFEYNFSNTRSF